MAAELTRLSRGRHAAFTEATFRQLAYDQTFTDVTLACEDGGQVRAHRVVLAASSTLFRRILAETAHPHPLLFLQGVEVATLNPLLHFIYQGEVHLPTTLLDTFHQAAKLLGIGGLEKEDMEDTEPEDEEMEGDAESILAKPAKAGHITGEVVELEDEEVEDEVEFLV